MLCCRAARGRRWIELTADEHRAYVMRLLDALEVTDRDKRLKVARAILYLAQGGCGPPLLGLDITSTMI